jgi:hypothetical protein
VMSIRGQAIWTKMTSPGGKLTALACHLTGNTKGGSITVLLTSGLTGLESAV